MEEIINRFNEVAHDYESFKEKIPYYRRMIKVILEILDYYETQESPRRVCELGLGTGELAEKIIESYQPDYFEGVDGSIEMIRESEDRLKSVEVPSEVDLTHSKFLDWNPKRHYDWIYSSLSIHHLQDQDKISVFETIGEAIRDQGLFLLCDLIQRPADFMDLYKFVRKSRMLDEGFSEKEFRERWQKHVTNDVPATLEDVIRWLEEIGFSRVDCTWKDWNRTIIVGVK